MDLYQICRFLSRRDKNKNLNRNSTVTTPAIAPIAGSLSVRFDHFDMNLTPRVEKVFISLYRIGYRVLKILRCQGQNRKFLRLYPKQAVGNCAIPWHC